MTQIIFRATTATTVAAGAVITTGNVQILPSWAPPIQFIGTTQPWFALYHSNTTMADGGWAAPNGKLYQARVRAYGRRSTLHAGAEVFATSRRIENQYGSVRPSAFYILTYRAVGEISRP